MEGEGLFFIVRIRNMKKITEKKGRLERKNEVEKNSRRVRDWRKGHGKERPV